VSQNRVVATMRATEVLSDATNALAIEAADRRRRQPAGGEERLDDTVRPALSRPVADEPGRERGRGYYTDAALRITAADGVELGDGGFTTWTARLMNNAKQRCLVSCLATERLTALL
jgi:hypothetical protein